MFINQSNLTFTRNLRTIDVEGIVLHHAAAIICSIEDIHRWHLNNRVGWLWLSILSKKRW